MSKERYPDLNEEEDTIMDEIRDDNWRYFAEEGDNMKNICALMRDFYVNEKEEFIKRYFLVAFPHPKRGNIV